MMQYDMMTLAQGITRNIGTDTKILAIGGSDPSGGAGIQQDIRTITVLGAYAGAIPTALTVQSSEGVFDVMPAPSGWLRAQLETLLKDIEFDAIKIGMIGSKENIIVLSECLSQYRGDAHVVLDPVLASKNGHILMDTDWLITFLKRLMPVTTCFTPNLEEALCLLRHIGNKNNIKDPATSNPNKPYCPYNRAAQAEVAVELMDRLKGFSPPPSFNMIIKGGHLEEDDCSDLLVKYENKIDDGLFSVEARRINTPHSHGTGCAYASSIATFLGKGIEITEAMRLSQEFMSLSLIGASSIGGRGIGPVNPIFVYEREMEREAILSELKRAYSILKANDRAWMLAPEIQINLGYAMKEARDKGEVAAFLGRIVRVKDRLHAVSVPEFGASSHVARIILTVMQFDPKKRSAMDIRFDERFIKRAKELGYSIASFNRAYEPLSIKEKEGSSLVWGVKEAIERLKMVPDIIWDTGDVGKEPAIRVIGDGPVEVVKKAISLL